MTRKLLVTVVLMVVVTLFLYPQRDTLTSVFRMTEQPVVISKGNYGQSLVVEISFTHDGLEDWLKTLKQPFPLLMLDTDWISRSSKIIEQIKQSNIPTGLLGSKDMGEEEYTIQEFKNDLQIYKEHFGSNPLWFMTSDYKFTSTLQQFAFEQEINLLSPSYIYRDTNYQKINGAIVTLRIHEQSKPDFKVYNDLLEKEQFISIEENIFGYTVKTKKIPE